MGQGDDCRTGLAPFRDYRDGAIALGAVKKFRQSFARFFSTGLVHESDLAVRFVQFILVAKFWQAHLLPSTFVSTHNVSERAFTAREQAMEDKWALQNSTSIIMIPLCLHCTSDT